MVAKIGSMLAQRVLKNRKDLQKKFDKIFDEETDVTASTDSRASEALRILRENEGVIKSGLDKKSIGGEIDIKKGGDYIKDLL
jgi:uncharacterized protein YajQ (UPF0234 family)|tara:strand:- start:515 stop:763 length:249 start_codon:yes stop_codon:yes gene_type:complete